MSPDGSNGEGELKAGGAIHNEAANIPARKASRTLSPSSNIEVSSENGESSPTLVHFGAKMIFAIPFSVRGHSVCILRPLVRLYTQHDTLISRSFALSRPSFAVLARCSTLAVRSPTCFGSLALLCYAMPICFAYSAQ